MTSIEIKPELTANGQANAARPVTVKPRVVMMVANQFRHDTRVYKEARSLIEWGCEVHVLAMAATDLPDSERQDGIIVRRLPLPFGVGNVIRLACLMLCWWNRAMLKWAVRRGKLDVSIAGKSRMSQ